MNLAIKAGMKRSVMTVSDSTPPATLIFTETPNSATRPNKVSRAIVPLTVITLRSIPAFIACNVRCLYAGASPICNFFLTPHPAFRIAENGRKC